MKRTLAVALCTAWLAAVAPHPADAAVHARHHARVSPHAPGEKKHALHDVPKRVAATPLAAPDAVAATASAPPPEPPAWQYVFRARSGTRPFGGVGAHPPTQADARDLYASSSNRGVSASAQPDAGMLLPGGISLYQTVWHRALPVAHVSVTLFVSSPEYFGLHY